MIEVVAWISNFIYLLYYFVLFFVPLVLHPKTSELFEFNKLVLVYVISALIVSIWVVKMIVEKKIIFRRTILDIPLLLFLGAQVLSTIFSIDPRTSFLGYYSRFHGGLASSLSYSLLYWAYVANMDKDKTLKALRFLIASAILVSIYAALQHLGIDKDVWVQDVQNRVFSTFGQPNWLAAWIVALIPITWAFTLRSRPKDDQPLAEKIKVKRLKFQLKIQSPWLWPLLSSLFFLTLLYTKSRSGLLGFLTADLVFWLAIALTTFYHKQSIKKYIKKFLILHFAFLILALAIGTPWTPSIKSLVGHQPPASQPEVSGPVLETGGTESGEIRKIVWKGAIDIWRNYPILGSGVETFAYSYYRFRPIEHNLVSEWDFLYNKAHNEYLNFMATTGTVGLITYLILPVVFFYWSFRIITNDKYQINSNDKLKIGNWKLVLIGLISGYLSILATNFFGFSVVPVAIQFYLYPAMAITLGRESWRAGEYKKQQKLSTPQIIGSAISCSLALLLLYSIGRYWYGDYLFARGKAENNTGNYTYARNLLNKSVKLSSKESIFWDELAESTIGIALQSSETGNQERAGEFAKLAITESERAVSLSPKNVNLRRRQASHFIKLSAIEPTYLFRAKNSLLEAIELAPTEAKLFYNLALTYVRTGEEEKAIQGLRETIEMKSNYRDARLALALLLMDKGEINEAKNQLEYILENINPDDAMVKEQLQEMENLL